MGDGVGQRSGAELSVRMLWSTLCDSSPLRLCAYGRPQFLLWTLRLHLSPTQRSQRGERERTSGVGGRWRADVLSSAPQCAVPISTLRMCSEAPNPGLNR